MRYLETSAELQARDRGFFQATEQYLLERPELMRRHRIDPRRGRSARRARPGGRRAARRRHHARRPRAGQGRGRLRAAAGLRADGWRRPLAIVLDALRPAAATPLPVPPLSYEEIERALGIADDA